MGCTKLGLTPRYILVQGETRNTAYRLAGGQKPIIEMKYEKPRTLQR